ncbi:MAG: Minf_1886 family protein [Phycisphaerae bacterium]
MSKEPQKTLEEVARQAGCYPPEAYEFVREGLNYTVQRVHGDPSSLPQGQRHISGQQLCWGLRELALQKWGLMASAVLRRWNITSTYDFGRIVFALVENGLMQKQPSDSIEDFKDVYDFAEALDRDYQIALDD